MDKHKKKQKELDEKKKGFKICLVRTWKRIISLSKLISQARKDDSINKRRISTILNQSGNLERKLNLRIEKQLSKLGSWNRG